jgi:hypothetical protein
VVEDNEIIADFPEIFHVKNNVWNPLNNRENYISEDDSSDIKEALSSYNAGKYVVYVNHLNQYFVLTENEYSALPENSSALDNAQALFRVDYSPDSLLIEEIDLPEFGNQNEEDFDEEKQGYFEEDNVEAFHPNYKNEDTKINNIKNSIAGKEAGQYLVYIDNSGNYIVSEANDLEIPVYATEAFWIELSDDGNIEITTRIHSTITYSTSLNISS